MLCNKIVKNFVIIYEYSKEGGYIVEDEEIVNQLYVHAVGSLEKVSEKYEL